MGILDWSVFGIYFLALVAVIIGARRAKSIEDYAVGSRGIPAAIIFATLCANYIGPGYSMGLANKAADKGFIWFVIFLGFSAQTILVGQFIAPKLRQFSNAYTIGDIMGYRYGRLVQFISGVIAVALSAGFVGAIANATGGIIHQFTGIPFGWAIILSTTFVIAYSTFGGIKTDIILDCIQFVIFSIAVPLILLFIMGKEGLFAVTAKIPAASIDLGGHFPYAVLFGTFLGFLLGETLIPPYVNRALVAKDSANARKGFLLAGAYSIVWFFVCASIGVLEVATSGPSDNPYLTAMQKYLPAGLVGLAVAAMFSIIMSSQDSVLNAAGVTLNRDVLGLISPSFREPRKSLITSRILNVTIGVVATIFAASVPSVIDALMYCYTLWAPTIVLPLIIAALKKNVHPLTGLVAIVCGGLATGIWEWGLNNPYGVPSLLVGVLCNQAAFWLTQLLMQSRKVPGGILKPVEQTEVAEFATPSQQ